MFLGKSKVLASLAVIWLMAGLLIVSCDTDPVGVPPTNVPPVVQIVNIPPNESHFTANPVIYWYGTDADGYIISYKYLVTRQDTLISAGVNIENEAELTAYASANFDDGVIVKLNEADGNPTRQTVRLYAGADPADTVPQVFFVCAIDDDSAQSNVEYRIYSRNNNPPETEVRLGGTSIVFWDLKDTTATFKGIDVQWEGSDKLDYPSDLDKPVFEYYFQLFGPYDEVDTADLIGTVDTTDQTKLIMTAIDTMTNSPWLTTEGIKVWNLWRNESESELTREGWFVAKVTARDDAFVSDPTPAYTAFKAINPQFENHLIATVVTRCAPSLQPGDLLCASNTVDTLINYIRDVFQDAGFGEIEILPPSVPEKAYLGRYKNVIVFNDGEESSKRITTNHLDALSEYMDLGGNVWIWAPNPFAALITEPDPKLVGFTSADLVPVKYFDVVGQYNAAWKSSYIRYADSTVRGASFIPPSNEQFINGLAIFGKGFDDFEIDRSKGRIYATVSSAPVDWRGAPNTVYFVRDIYSEPLYLIDSYYGDFVSDQLKDYIKTLQGKVVALRYDARYFKSAVFGFSIWMMHQEDAVTMVQKMMQWFDE